MKKYLTKIPTLIALFVLIVILFSAYFKRQWDMEDAAKMSKLSPAQYQVLKQGSTEMPYTSPLLHETRKGTYVTADCREPVFRSEQKFDSGTGWPSFYAPIKEGAVVEQVDGDRTEIVSPICHSHLGHVFNDAPQTPTGLRYCINGIALLFIPD